MGESVDKSMDESVGKSMRGWMREFMAVDVL
jgi:hypothetical protein